MRTLQKNKRKLYKVSFLGTERETDEFGNYTGERKRQYSVPEEIWINFRVMSGIISSEIFGNHSDYDMTAISEEPILAKDDLLFEEMPPSDVDYFTTYDLKVDDVSPSLNTYAYGFRRRI